MFLWTFSLSFFLSPYFARVLPFLIRQSIYCTWMVQRLGPTVYTILFNIFIHIRVRILIVSPSHCIKMRVISFHGKESQLELNSILFPYNFQYSFYIGLFFLNDDFKIHIKKYKDESKFYNQIYLLILLCVYKVELLFIYTSCIEGLIYIIYNY